MGKTPVDKTRQHLPPQICLGIFRELEYLSLRGPNLRGGVLTWTVVKKIQGECPQMAPHLKDPLVNLSSEIPEGDGTSDLEEGVALLKKPLGDREATAHCKRRSVD